MFKMILKFFNQRKVIDALQDQVKAMSEELILQKQQYKVLFDEFCELLKRHPLEVTVKETNLNAWHQQHGFCPACEGTCTFKGFDWSTENIIAPLITGKIKK